MKEIQQNRGMTPGKQIKFLDSNLTISKKRKYFGFLENKSES